MITEVVIAMAVNYYKGSINDYNGRNYDNSYNSFNYYNFLIFLFAFSPLFIFYFTCDALP